MRLFFSLPTRHVLFCLFVALSVSTQSIAGSEPLPRLPPEPGGISWLTFSPDGKYLATKASDDKGEIKLWDLTNGKVVRTVVVRDPFITGFLFTPDGKELVCMGPRPLVAVVD